MEKFLSCDWGTSTFRLRLINADNLRVLAETTHESGIADTHRQWLLQPEGSLSRRACYTAVLKQRLDELSQRAGIALDDIPIVLSGMASSSMGMVELPYKSLPFDLDGSDLIVEALPNLDVSNPIFMVSGARTDHDVMRGEETKVLGCSAIVTENSDKQLLILPGTHPKHIIVIRRQAVELATYMTGEFFDLLSTHSVLSTSVEAGANFGDAEAQRWFSEGVEASRTSGMLKAAFKVRTNELLRQIPKTHNFYYLSGILIGSELQHITPAVPVYLIAGSMHRALYKKALQIIDVPIAGELDADLALIKGQRMILSRLS
ncbi:2-dehydro-3-deoxygalactonokinase [Parapedobacter deserti]|uniref:2-dehydro-3-deoxygalactonokinase n=1 Tax=Parapedobacter deserti TaxID=1912957 RepID=A0ABV7JMA7_9SPHI